MSLVFRPSPGLVIDRGGATYPATIKGDAPEDADIVEARDLAESSVPADLGGFALKNVEVREMAVEPRPIYEVEATYGSPPGAAGGETLDIGVEREEWDAGSEMVRVYYSIETVSATPEEAPNYNRMIAVDDEGKPQGVDRPEPMTRFSVRTRKTGVDANRTYRQAVAAVVGSVNSTTFRGYAAGQVRLMGAPMKERDDGSWDITFNFEVSLNATNVPVGNLEIPAKEGWDLVWGKPAPKHDGDNNALVSEFVAAYVERVSPRVNFSVLGIETS